MQPLSKVERSRASITKRPRLTRDELSIEKLIEYGHAIRDSTGCLKWLAARARHKEWPQLRYGYGVINIKNEPTRLVHRLAYEVTHNDLPECVMHECDTPMCFEPTHLVGGTTAENNADMQRKGRARGSRSRPRRPTWDETWIESAEIIGRRSRCVRRQAGCVIVTSDNQITAQGYNGPPAGLITSSDMCSSFCPRATTKETSASYDNCVASHAEANALIQSDRGSHVGGTAYVSTSPCFGCAKLLANSGLKKIVTRVLPQDWYRDPQHVLQFLMSCGLEVVVAP